MSNWKAGDKALYFRKGTGRSDANTPNGLCELGQTYVVSDIADYWGGSVIGLIIDHKPAFCSNTGISIGWDSENFRKIVPLCDRETNEQSEPTKTHNGFENE